MISIPNLFSLHINMFFNETPLSFGTGFLMNSPSGHVYLITNRHNLTGRHNETGECLSETKAIPNRIEISHITGSPAVIQWARAMETQERFKLSDEMLSALKSRTIVSEPLLSESGDPLWFEHPSLQQRADFCALQLTNFEGIQTITFQKSFSRPLILEITETVSVIGYPFGKSNNNFPVWANGTIASDPILNYEDLPIMLIDCPSRSGQSGSPVFRHVTSGMVSFENHNMQSVTSPISRFVGIYSGRIHKDSNVGLVWKEAAVYELVDSLP